MGIPPPSGGKSVASEKFKVSLPGNYEDGHLLHRVFMKNFPQFIYSLVEIKTEVPEHVICIRGILDVDYIDNR